MILNYDDNDVVEAVIRCLNLGKVTIIPFDTIYGFAGRVPDTDSKIRTIKGRGETKPFLQLAPNIDAVKKITENEIPGEILNLWPGPVTMIINDNSGKSRAVRVPDDPFLERILSGLEYFVYSTSVNLSGKPFLRKIDEIISCFGKKADLIVDHGDMEEGKASTILDIREKPYRILRQGAAVIPEELLNLP